MWCLAINTTSEVGIDVESIERNSNIKAIAGRYFSAQESNKLFQTTAKLQKELFFSYWTLKEAFLKATGTGLKGGLNHCVFDFDALIAQPSMQPYAANISFLDKKTSGLDTFKYQCFRFKPDDEHLIALVFQNRQAPAQWNLQLKSFALPGSLV